MRKRVVTAVLVMSAAAGASFLVTAAPAGAVTVSDELGLRTAFADSAETQIDLANDITLINCAPIGGDLDRNSATALSINGNGFTITQTCVGQRVMQQAGTGAVTVDGITLTGGNDTGNGGGIDAELAPITVTNSTITGNSAGGNGGGIAQTGIAPPGMIEVTNSTISGNDAGGNGGGIAQTGTAGATFEVTNSTISGNEAGGNGGGLAQTAGTMTVTNSTISNNSAAFNGGGLAPTGGSLALVYSTVVQNGATQTGFNINFGGSMTSFGSVVALAQGGGANCNLFGPAPTSNGFNFSDDDTCGFTAGTDSQNAGDPGLGALADNGGPTQTRLPQDGSPLIDTIPTDSCQADGAGGITADQRGVTRPQIGGCDTGSVEVEGPTPGPGPAPAPVGPAPAAPVAAAPRFTG